MEQSHANVDPAEVRRFEELATRWWDPHSEFRPLHDINPLRMDYIDRRAGLAGKRVLDVGCGGGILSESMVDAGATVTGIDMGEACLAVAKLHQLESGIAVDYRHATAEAVAAEEAGQYDIVTCMEMLEHVPEPAQVIAACAELVRPGGDVFFSTINRNPKSYLLAIIGAEYLLRLLPRGTHDYARFIKPSEMDNWCRATGLDIADLIGMTYNPITRSYALGRDIDVNYIAHYRRPD